MRTGGEIKRYATNLFERRGRAIAGALPVLVIWAVAIRVYFPGKEQGRVGRPCSSKT